MGDKVDMSLDDIIAADRKTKRGSFGGSGGRGRFNSGNRGAQRGGRRNSFNSNYNNGYSNNRGSRGGGGGGYRDSYDARRTIPMSSGPGKLLISNLDYGVSEGDLYELFSEFGNLKMATIHYDRRGMSLGTAEVAFDRKSDAIKGLKQYNGVPLDGKPMRIEMTGTEREIMDAMKPSYSVPRRGGGIPPRRGGGMDRRGGRGGRGTGRGGSRGRGGAGGGRKENGPAPSKEKLDEEMDAYMSNKDA